MEGTIQEMALGNDDLEVEEGDGEVEVEPSPASASCDGGEDKETAPTLPATAPDSTTATTQPITLHTVCPP